MYSVLCMYLFLLFSWKQGVASQQTAGEGAGVFGRFRFLNQRASSQGEDSLSCHTIDLRTSTIKIDADENDLRFCFRIISPVKTFTLQVTALLVLRC
jgi:Arf-GAP/coiled-coil/ANK repeat/PH domain-containing protein